MLAQGTQSDPFVEHCMRAQVGATTGDFREADALIASLAERDDALSLAWRTALRMQRWHAAPEGVFETPDDVRRLADASEEARWPAVLAAAEGVRRAVILQRGDELADWVMLLRRVVDDDSDGRLLVWRQLAEGWLAVSRGEGEVAGDFAQSAGAIASEVGLPAARLEATVLRGYGAELRGDLAESTSAARTASRMARTEDLPQWQYLSSLLLARVRRLHGTPHLATRILSPMLQVAPVHWRGWIAWEVAMAGAVGIATQIELVDASDPVGEARALRGVVAAAQSGSRDSFADALQILRDASPRLWRSRQLDAALATMVLDPDDPLTDAPEALRAWAFGVVPSPPPAIQGLCADLEADLSDAGIGAFIVAVPPGTTQEVMPRRIAGLAEPLVADHARVERIKGKFERVLSGLAAIALSGREGIANVELFQSIYGFPYESSLHRGLLKTLRHRIRRLLDDSATIVLEDDRARLELTKPLVIPDPRCGQPLENLVLRVVARMGVADTKEAAKNLGVPLRTLQSAMKQLVDEGALNAERDGRQIRYMVEDTTFSEPTKWSIDRSAVG